MTQTAFAMTRPLRSRWDQEGAEFVQSNSEWCARACARLLALNSQLQAADALQLVQEWSPEGWASRTIPRAGGRGRRANAPRQAEINQSAGSCSNIERMNFQWLTTMACRIAATTVGSDSQSRRNLDGAPRVRPKFTRSPN